LVYFTPDSKGMFMKNAFWLALTFAVVLGYTATQVQARGGHGGGHHAGHPGNHHPAQHHHHNSHHHAHYNGHHPFSPGWYGNHAGAWGNGVGYGNLWAPATFGAAAAWLGMSAANPATYSYPQVTSVYTGDNGSPNGQANQTAGNSPQAPSYLAQANQLAQGGAANTPKEAAFLPLGVFSLAPEKEKDATAMVQLAMSKEGVLRGTYYDLEDDEELPIQGAVDKKTQRVAFTLGDDSQDVFETALSHLTDESGPLAVHSKDGKTSRWTLARFDKAPPAVDESKEESHETGDDAPGAEAKSPNTST
jgi:hypothetical protein